MRSDTAWMHWRWNAALLLCASCAAPRDRLDLEGIEPDSGAPGANTPVTIRGHNFHPAVRISYDDSGRSELRAGFSATLGDVSLTDVVWIDPATLSATVPPTVEVGVHDLTVTAPDGTTAVLSAAFHVDLVSNADVQQLSNNLLGDGTPFAFLLAYGNDLVAGPRADGSGAVRFPTAGGPAQTLEFSFARDSAGNQHDNASPAPYRSIGRSGCVESSEECGPDNENGRGVFAVGIFAGVQWLVLGGARGSSAVEYVYMSSDTDAQLDFSYVDLSQPLGAQTRGLTAVDVFADRLYLGFSDSGAARPSLLVVQRTPAAPGIDVTENGGDCAGSDEVCNLQAELLTGMPGTGSVAIIDAIYRFTSRMYVVNSGAWFRSTTPVPQPPSITPSDWADATPSAAAWRDVASLPSTQGADLEPADRSVPALAAFGNQLFVARNTVVGCQLWMCTPGTVSNPAPASSSDCDPGDWELLAPDAMDARFTRFGNAANERIALLAATATHLYVGYNNAVEGVVLFRTTSPTPRSAGQFEGAESCSAADHPASCEGLGGSGFGSAGRSRILSSAVGADGRLYVVVGDGSIPAELFRF